MGLLKHFLLPAFALMHGLLFFQIVVLGNKAQIGQPLSGGVLDVENDTLTPLEEHAMGALGAYNAALCFVHIMAIFSKSSSSSSKTTTIASKNNIRGMAITMEAIFLSLDTYDIVMLGRDAGVMYLLTAAAWLGLLVHSQEPGIFTKDKKKSDNETGTTTNKTE